MALKVKIEHILFTLYMTMPIIAGAQTSTIYGTISAEGEPLPYAVVVADGRQVQAVADDQGRYELSGLPHGKVTISVSYIGYTTKRQELQLAAGERRATDFELEPSGALREVVVTGTMKPTYVSESPIKVDVITAKQLNTYLPSASSSLMDGILLVSGVQEVVACGVCFTNSISINGLPGPYTAILMDGTPMYGNLASVYGLNGIPNTIIERFEVIKGPSSTLYGSEAVAGVINIITKDPATQPRLSIDIMGTSHLESFGNASVSHRIGKTTGFTGLNYAYINDFDDYNGDGFGDRANLDRYSVFTKWNISQKNGRRFTIAGKYYYEDRRNGVEAFLRNRGYRRLRGSDSIYGESIYTRRVEVFGTYEFPLATGLRLDYSYSNHDQDSYYGSDRYQAKQDIAFANLLWNIGVGRHDILAGMTARYQTYDDNTVATEAPGPGGIVNRPDEQFIPGIFLQDEWRLSSAWTLLGGARLDHYTSHGPIFAPRLNVKFKPSDWTTLRTNFGTGFRVVNLFTEDHAFVTGQRTVEIAEALKPERSYNGSFNINQVYSLGSGAGNIDLEAFYTYFTNKILPDYSTPGKIIYANSRGHAQTAGIGMTINHSFSWPLSFNMGFNLQRVTQTEPDDTGTLATRPIEYAPRWTSIFSINYNWKKQNIVFAYTLRITGPMALPEVFDLDGNGEPLPLPRPTVSTPFAFQNLQVMKTFNANWSIYGGIQNLFNYRQQISPIAGFNDPATAPGFSSFFDTSYAYSPIHGREFYLGVKWGLPARSK